MDCRACEIRCVSSRATEGKEASEENHRFSSEVYRAWAGTPWLSRPGSRAIAEARRAHARDDVGELSV